MALSDAQEYDPFAAFDDAVAGTTRDPYPSLAVKRRDTPVRKDMAISPENLPEGIDVEPGWMAFRYEDCSRILRDAKTFTSTGYDVTIGMVMGHMILGMDDPEHRTHRNLVAHAFREKALARWEPEFIRPIIDEQIDRFAADGEADLVRQLTFEFPVRVIARLLGLPEEDFPQFQRWSVELISLVADIDRGIAASESLREYFAGVVAERRAHPAEDVISDLVTAEIDGEHLDDEAIYSFLRLLLPAGAETTYRSSGNLLFLLLTHPEQLEAVRADRSLLPQAIEEGLRYEPPLLTINRTTTCEVELAGVTIGPGESITPHLGSANHDETRWDDPDAFDIFRPSQPHIAFAHGPHMCLGMHLARIETRVLLNRVFDRLGDLELQLDAGDPHIRGDVFRSPTSLPVVVHTGCLTRGDPPPRLRRSGASPPRRPGRRTRSTPGRAGTTRGPRRPGRRRAGRPGQPDQPPRPGSRPTRPRRACVSVAQDRLGQLAQSGRQSEGQELQRHRGVEPVDGLVRRHDDDEAVGGGRHDALAGVRTAAALDEPSGGIHLIGPVDGDVEPVHLGEGPDEPTRGRRPVPRSPATWRHR